MLTTVPMGSIRGRWQVLVVWALLFAGPALHGQSTPQNQRSPLTAELQKIERTLENTNISLAARHGALVRRAQLLRLAGNIEGAATAWIDAAFVDAAAWDDGSLLEGARCFIALGELDKAETHIKTVLLTGKNAGLLHQARYLGACIEAFRSGSGRILSALLGEPDYSEQKPAILYTLWHLSGSESFKTRLLAEFPASPEARILRGIGTSIRPSALWFLPPGREGVRFAEPVRVQSPARQPLPLVSSPPPPTAVDTGGRASVLQTGLFSREENARGMIARLRNAGFPGAISPRIINGTAYWVVTVPAGPDMKETILRLKDAGFESFPVF